MPHGVGDREFLSLATEAIGIADEEIELCERTMRDVRLSREQWRRAECKSALYRIARDTLTDIAARTARK